MQSGFTKIDIGLLLFYAMLGLAALIMYWSTRDAFRGDGSKKLKRKAKT